MSILNALAVTTDMYRSSYSSSSDMEDLLGGLMSNSSAAQGAAVWTMVSLILALVGGILIYFLFVKKKVNPVNKFLAWMKSFLRFDKILVEDIAKVTYLIFALFITLNSFSLLAFNFLAFLFSLVLGNLLLRVVYELTMIMIMIWSNTTAIKQGLCKDAGAKKEVEEKKK